MTRNVITIRAPAALGAVLAGLVVLAGLHALTGCAPIRDETPDRPPGKTEPVNVPKSKGGEPDSLKERVKAALDQVKNRDLLTTHSFWTVFHGILGNGLGATIRDTFTKEEHIAVDYIRDGGKISGMTFLVHEKILEGKDGIGVQVGPTFYGQGHQDQFVCEMAQLGLPLSATFKIRYKEEVREYTFEDFLRCSKANARVKGSEELTWTMPAIAQYYGTKLSWENKWGDTIRFEDMVAHEVEQPIESAACGGTHRLFGLTWAYYIHRRDGGTMTPVWQKVDAKLKAYCANARKYQNSGFVHPSLPTLNGSFSTEYFKGPGRSPDLDRQIGTTGHIVEWLSLYLPDEQIHAAWMQEAVSSLVLMIFEGQNQLLDGGSIYHAAHGLHLYYYRAWGAEDANPAAKVIPPVPKK